MTPFLKIDDLNVVYPGGSPAWSRLRRRPPGAAAVDHVSLTVEAGTSVGIVGESGCGKTTLAKAIIGLIEPTGGTIRLDGNPLTTRRDRRTRQRIQMVFQDPGASLNPKMTIGDAIGEMLHIHGLRSGAGINQRVRELLDLVELPTAVLDRRPHTLSGGQRQRVAIARAIALEPDLLIADEAVAALDVSVQAAVLNLLNDLRKMLGLTMLFISHDLGVVRQITDRAVVMYLGRIVEDQPTDALLDDPQHPYTRALIAAAPRLGSAKRPGEHSLAGEIPTALAHHVGCSFQQRCPQAEAICASDRPELTQRDATHAVACHLPDAGRAETPAPPTLSARASRPRPGSVE